MNWNEFKTKYKQEIRVELCIDCNNGFSYLKDILNNK